MRSGRVKADDIRNRQVGPPCASVWYTPEYENVLAEIYENNGPVTIADIVSGSTRVHIPGYDPDAPPQVDALVDTIVTLLDPTIIGEKVFLCWFADIAEMQLEEFEASEFNNPAPRAMCEGLRALAFKKITLEEFKVLQDAAYGEGDGNEENNRADVSYLGRLATLPYPSKEFTDWAGEMYIKFNGKSVDQLQAMIDRLGEFDRGAVDLEDDVTARPTRGRR